MLLPATFIANIKPAYFTIFAIIVWLVLSYIPCIPIHMLLGYISPKGIYLIMAINVSNVAFANIKTLKILMLIFSMHQWSWYEKIVTSSLAEGILIESHLF